MDEHEIFAVCHCPPRGDLIPSHASYEIGYRLAMEAMELEPFFLLGMRLGDGSGSGGIWPNGTAAVLEAFPQGLFFLEPQQRFYSQAPMTQI